MNTVRTMKLGVISGVAGVALILGGLFLSGSLAGAQEPPSPTPQQQEVQPTPTDPGTTPDMTPRDRVTPRDDKECEKDGTEGTSGARFGGRSGSSAGVQF